MEDYTSISRENISYKEKNRVYKNLIAKEGNLAKNNNSKSPKKAISSLQFTKRESFNQTGKNSKKNVTNLNSTAVTNLEISARSFINEKCPEVETLKHTILVSNNLNQTKLVPKEDNTNIKSPKLETTKKKNISTTPNIYETEMDLRRIKHELERDLDI